VRILARDGADLAALWLRERTRLRVEIVGGHVFVALHGVVAAESNIELVIAHGDGDEASISLFCCTHRVIEPTPEEAATEAWRGVSRVVQIQTDGGAQCTIAELAPP
jgi:hypothetical protein